MVQSTGRLTGRTILITGGAAGFGRSCALHIADEGADVAVLDIDPDGAEEVADEVRRRGRRAFAQRTDVTEPDSVRSGVAAAIEALGPLHGAVNSAGTAPPSSALLGDYDVNVWD